MQNLGLALFVLGAIGLVLYLVVQVINDPKILGRLAQILRRTQRTVEVAKEKVATAGVGGLTHLDLDEIGLSPDTLEVGDTFHYDPNGDGSVTATRLTIIEKGSYTAVVLIPEPNVVHKQYNFRDQRASYPVLIAQDAGGTFALLWKHDAGWYVLPALESFPDAFKDSYKAAGKAFQVAGGNPGDYSFVLDGVTHAIQYEGYMRFSSQLGKSTVRGPYYLPNTEGEITPLLDIIKVMVTHGSDGFVHFFEQMATPDNTPAARLPLQISLIWKGTAVPNQPGYIFE